MHEDTKNLAGQIREHMEVIGSDGTRIGVVDHVEGDQIKLTKSSSTDGTHELVPLTLVSRVDEHVHVSTPGTIQGG